jgi:hypothetical protein
MVAVVIEMNERIKQFADKIWAEEYWDNPATDKLLPAQLNKFAELIVRECVGVMYDNAIERKVPPDIDKTPLQYAIAIKEHFGVE